MLVDEKTVLLDTVDQAVNRQFLDNIKAVLNGRTLDYLVVNHMEPDHCAVIEELIIRYPDLKLICNAKTVAMIKQFYDFDEMKEPWLLRKRIHFPVVSIH